VSDICYVFFSEIRREKFNYRNTHCLLTLDDGLSYSSTLDSGIVLPSCITKYYTIYQSLYSGVIDHQMGSIQEGQHPLTGQRARQFQAGLKGDVGL